LRHAAVWGALFGFFTHATYDLTNLALLKDWPLKVVIVDILWGVVLCSVVASLSFCGANISINAKMSIKPSSSSNAS